MKRQTRLESGFFLGRFKEMFLERNKEPYSENKDARSDKS